MPSALKAYKFHKLTGQQSKTLFWDKNIGNTIPTVLQFLNPSETNIRYYLQDYPGNIYMPEGGDDFWLRDVGQKGWFVISQDHNFHKRERELFALKQYEVGCFYLPGANSPKWESFRCFMRAYDQVISAMNSSPRPFLYRIQWNGSLTQVDLS